MSTAKKIVLNKQKDILDLEKINPIIQWAKENPLDDYICAHFRVSGSGFLKPRLCSPDDEHILKMPSIEGYGKSCIAGSAALRQLIDLCFHKTTFQEWSPNDVDIFCLDYPEELVGHFVRGINVIYCKDSSIDELLNSFDMPVCRVALDFNGTMSVTAQALYSIYERKMNVPEYIVNEEQFHKVVNNFGNLDGKYKFNGKIQKLYDQFSERAKKYGDRGFSLNPVYTDKVLPFLLGRIEYVSYMESFLSRANVICNVFNK